MYSVHSQGSCYHTALAVLPHICLSVLFAFGLWTQPGWFVMLLFASLVISAFGWKKGRPSWTHPWLGYTLIAPIVSWGLAMSAVGYGAWGGTQRYQQVRALQLRMIEFGERGGVEMAPA